MQHVFHQVHSRHRARQYAVAASTPLRLISQCQQYDRVGSTCEERCLSWTSGAKWRIQDHGIFLSLAQLLILSAVRKLPGEIQRSLVTCASDKLGAMRLMRCCYSTSRWSRSDFPSLSALHELTGTELVRIELRPGTRLAFDWLHGDFLLRHASQEPSCWHPYAHSSQTHAKA